MAIDDDAATLLLHGQDCNQRIRRRGHRAHECPGGDALPAFEQCGLGCGAGQACAQPELDAALAQQALSKLGERPRKLWEDEFACVHENDTDVASIEVAEVSRDGAHKIVQFGHNLNTGEATASDHKRQEGAAHLRIRLNGSLLQSLDDAVSQSKRIPQVLERKRMLCKAGQIG